MDPRAELDRLRKAKRMQELQAKAGVSAEPTAPVEEAPAKPANHSLPRHSVWDGLKEGGVSGAWDAAQKNKAAYDAEEHPVVAGMPPMAIPAAALPKAVGKVAEVLNSTAPRRIATAAAQGYATDGAKGALLSGGTALGGEGLGKLLRGGGDVAMQAAVGRKKYTPGVGETLADEGIVGTERMMKGQVANKLGKRAEQMHEIAGEIPEGAIDPAKIGQEVFDESARPFQVPGSQPSAADLPKLQAAEDFTQDIMSRGPESGPQALARRIAAGQRSYRGSEDPLKSLIGQMSKGEQVKYSQALKGADKTGKLPEVDKAYGALKRAEKSLDQEATLPKSLFQLFSTGANVVPGGALGLSAAGQAAVKGGQAAQGATSAPLRQLLLELNKDR